MRNFTILNIKLEIFFFIYLTTSKNSKNSVKEFISSQSNNICFVFY